MEVLVESTRYLTMLKRQIGCFIVKGKMQFLLNILLQLIYMTHNRLLLSIMTRWLLLSPLILLLHQCSQFLIYGLIILSPLNQRCPRLCGFINQVAHSFSNSIVAIGLQINPYNSHITFYIVGLCKKTLRNALFVDSADSIVAKMVVMMRIVTEEKAGIKKCFGTFLSFLVCSVYLQTRSQNCCDGIKRSISRMLE
jgi:hypothetical protein